MVGQGPAMLAAGAGGVGCFFVVVFFVNHLVGRSLSRNSVNG